MFGVRGGGDERAIGPARDRLRPAAGMDIVTANSGENPRLTGGSVRNDVAGAQFSFWH